MTMIACASAVSPGAAAPNSSRAAVAALADAVMSSPQVRQLKFRGARPRGYLGRGLPREMAWAGRVLVPGRVEHDQCRCQDLDPAERDEDASVDGDGTCCGQNGRQEPYLKGRPADAGRTVGPDEMRNLRDVSCSGQPGADKARDLGNGGS